MNYGAPSGRRRPWEIEDDTKFRHYAVWALEKLSACFVKTKYIDVVTLGYNYAQSIFNQ